MNPIDNAGHASPAVSDGIVPEETIALTPPEIDRRRRQIAHNRRLLSSNGGRKRLHTLIVEDQAFTRSLLSQVLSQTCSVATCSNAKDGWRLYVDEVPDITFLDIDLPGVSGHALADKIKEVDPDSYVVMVTASQDVYDIQIAKFNRVDGFVIKPFNKQKIDACIERFCLTHKMHGKARPLS